jgi:SagB-type dehydrogenase family enzyme
MSLEEAIQARRSVRFYSDELLTLEELSQVLWAAQGITDPTSGHRASPSAGATYPIQTYLIVHDADGLDPGIYSYIPASHSLEPYGPAVDPEELAAGALGQPWVSDCSAVLLLAAVFERTTGYYGDRGVGYVYMEAGHISQNVYLQCASLGLGTVAVGAFTDSDVARLVGLPEDEIPLYMMPLGRLI